MDLLIPLFILSAGLLVLVAGGELLLRGAVGLAWRFGLSPLVIGLTVVSFATSLPELVVSVHAGLLGKPLLGLGNIIGSNLANSLLILGVGALLVKLVPERGLAKRDGLVMFAATLLLVIFSFFGQLSWLHGLIMLGSLFAYLFLCFYQERKSNVESSTTEEVEDTLATTPKTLPLVIVYVILGGAALAFGAELVVGSAIDLAREFGVSEATIGLSMVAFGTSLPELATIVVAALRRHSAVALGNIIGSNIFNILGIMGTLALVSPFAVPASFVDFEIWALLTVTLLLYLLLLFRVTLRWPTGLALTTLYLLFVFLLYDDLGDTIGL
ncbi:calcium/sodium antiporter [Rhodovibrionaceae bacterium A322]